MIGNLLLATYHNPMRVCDSADFNADLYTRGADLTGAADSKSGILSFWFRLDGTDSSAISVVRGAGSPSKFACIRAATNFWEIFARNAAGTVILDFFNATGSQIAGAAWHHFLASWDLNTAGARAIYLDDVLDTGTVSTFTNDTIDYTAGDVGLGNDVAGVSSFDGCLAEVYFAPGQYLDFSLVSNRRKFRSASGKPVHLGTDGSLPTGVVPRMYHHLDDAEAVANIATNRGGGGNFSLTGGGGVTAGSNSPSD